MKKVFLSLLLAGAVAGFSNAQQSVGGIPWSISNRSVVENSKAAVLSLPTPDFTKARKEDDYNEAMGRPGKYRAALGVKTNINLSSGSFTYLNDGSIVWRLQVAIPTSIAMKVEYTSFVLPKGVTYFVQNGNKDQLIGGFDYTSNPNSESMAHDMVQGDVVNMEMDIAAGVDLSQIQLQVDHMYGFYRGANTINNLFGEANVSGTYQLGQADTCGINLNCPVASPWYTYSFAVAHIWITDIDTAGATGGFCSGTLIGNTANDCKAYFLTASHCDEENNYNSPHFKFWEFTFDFRAPRCEGGGTPNTSKILKGADFKARSFYTIPSGATTGPLYGDFILLQLKDPTNQLSAWDRYLAGWNRTNQTNDSIWVGFHHPKGDVMKFTKYFQMDSTGATSVFNTDSLGTHWGAHHNIGGTEPGSSGSGLWEGSTGRLLGDLTGGLTPSQAKICTPSSAANSPSTYAANYSKIWHNWYNTYDSAHSIMINDSTKGPETYWSDSINATNSRLQPWLDPTNSGVTTLNMTKVNPSCTLVPFTYVPLAIADVKALESGISLYPNPSTGVVTMAMNLQKSKDLNVDVFNMLGQKVNSYVIKNASLTQNANFDLTAFPNGIYLFKISTENASITKKVIISK
jgi:hypothetical protein